jgi:hypothetical protein
MLTRYCYHEYIIISYLNCYSASQFFLHISFQELCHLEPNHARIAENSESNATEDFPAAGCVRFTLVDVLVLTTDH